MLKIAPQRDVGDLNDLRLLALSRITRCADCPRYHALDHAYHSVRPATGLPPVPRGCHHQVCAPLVLKLVRSIA